MALARPATPGEGPFGPSPPEPVVWNEGRRAVVALSGEQDLSTAASVAEALARAAALVDGEVAVDLSGVAFMDASIVGALLHARKALRPSGRALTVRVPSRQARFVLGLCGLAGLIESAPGAVPESIGRSVTLRGSWLPHSSGGGAGAR